MQLIQDPANSRYVDQEAPQRRVSANIDGVIETSHCLKGEFEHGI